MGQFRRHPTTWLPAGTPADGFWGRTRWSRGGFGSFVRLVGASYPKGAVWGLGLFWGTWGEKSPPKKSFGMCLGVMWEGINDVSG